MEDRTDFTVPARQVKPLVVSPVLAAVAAQHDFEFRSFPFGMPRSACNEQCSLDKAAIATGYTKSGLVPVTVETLSYGFATCNFPGCTERIPPWSLKEHFQAAHPCPGCDFSGPFLIDLAAHAATTGHAPFACSYKSCEREFSRSDSLKRHIAQHLESQPRYECPHCYKHNGEKAFKRRDHLTQHLRGYHNIGVDAMRSKSNSCPHATCDQYRPGVFATDGSPIFQKGDRYWGYVVADKYQAFKSTKAFQDHMRKSHNETPFQCPVPGCDRKGAKGWFRKREYIKHHQKDHGGELPELDLPKWFVG